MKKATAVCAAVFLTFFVGLFWVLGNQVKGDSSDAVAAITQLENEK